MKENEEKEVQKEIKREEKINKPVIKASTSTSSLLLITILFVILGFAGYMLFGNKEKLDDGDSNPTPTSKPVATSEESLIKDPLMESDITKNEVLNRKIDRDIRDVDVEIKDYDLPKGEFGTNNVHIELKNGILNYTFNDQVFNIENIKQLKSDHVTYEMLLFAFTNDNEIWYCNLSHDVYMPNNKLDKAPEFKKLKGKYKDVKMLHMAYTGDSDLRDYLLVGLDDKYYTLSDQVLYDVDIYEHINYNHYDLMKSYVKTNGDIYLNGKLTNVKYKLGIYDSYGSNIRYILSTDNYLYDDTLKKYSNSKVVKISSTERDKKNGMQSSVVEFEDGTKAELLYLGIEKK